jgi:hypothetical protein
MVRFPELFRPPVLERIESARGEQGRKPLPLPANGPKDDPAGIPDSSWRTTAQGNARQTTLGRNSLKHIKAFLNGVFKEAKRLGILDGVNPMQDVSVPKHQTLQRPTPTASMK